MTSQGLSVVFAMLAGLLGAEPAGDPGMYLPPSETGGTEYQFNPASPALRRAVKKPWPKQDELIDARALADDLVFLRRALRKQYIGYPELLQLPDWDVEATFDQQIGRLRAGPAQVKFGESLWPMFRELKSHINDMHFGMIGHDPDPKSRYSEYQAEYQGPIAGAAPALDRCTGPQVSPTTVRLAPLLGPDGKRVQVLTASAQGQAPALELTCGDKRFALKQRPRAPREEGIWDKSVYEWHRAGQAAILRIRRFDGDPKDIERLKQLARDYPQHRRSPVIVVDMRGNGGGDDGYAYDWVEQARRGTWDSGVWSVHPVGSAIPWLRWNHEVWSSIKQDRVDDAASVAEREKLRREWPRSPAELSIEFKPHRNRTEAKLPYKGRIFVLVDSDCGSSGESAAMFFREALGATVVGERTGGYQEYGNVRTLALPRTGFAFHFATKRNYFRQPMEAVGLPADLYLAPELMARPVEELLPLLLKLPVAKARDAEPRG